MSALDIFEDTVGKTWSVKSGRATLPFWGGLVSRHSLSGMETSEAVEGLAWTRW